MTIYVILLYWIISEDTPGTLVASIHLQYWSRRESRIQRSFWAGDSSPSQHLPVASAGMSHSPRLCPDF